MIRYPVSRFILRFGVKNYFIKYRKYLRELADKSTSSEIFSVEYSTMSFPKYMDLLIFKTISEDCTRKKWKICFHLKRGMSSLWEEFKRYQASHPKELQTFDEWLVNKYKFDNKEDNHGCST